MKSITINKTVIDYTNPSTTRINVNDLATRLSRLPRYTGDIPWTVAKHTALVSYLICCDFIVRDNNLFVGVCTKDKVKLHDVHEAYTGDIPTPLKLVLGQAIYDVEYQFDIAIYGHFGFLLPTEEEKATISFIDKLALIAEGDYFDHPLVTDHLLDSTRYQAIQDYYDNLPPILKTKIIDIIEDIDFLFDNVENIKDLLLINLSEETYGVPVWQ